MINRDTERGFTLVEMAAVLLIISVLLLLLVPSMTDGKSRADSVSCEGSVRIVESEINLYYAEHKTYPETLAVIKRGGATDPLTYSCQSTAYTYAPATGTLTKK
ncbi:MAG: prepilin-type N-terminal cleavage/methylation domain-containing protein [Exiguobacterium sp.]|uniref:Prepilin-type N-terminal cleavage/methylation domain-containing protein n=1 Tax=Exiguobacterium alkaliphilum TaxID=1428684 RepID=A0ABT2KXC6_9BACL|nr:MULTISPECIES: prepilin-type N-terminal cleavage/methylation domain-containing protein [Exiguobacterium]MDX5323713.1 prepilin-type N-terminal cleavage/methylation domain-containing protein [Exiguobacterium sp.]MCT4795587.1 prepilin-type N-terminal cleavage/methylation domain-containing protein [Exiguobacterium alkaliphilum]MDX5425521.1 prepilin-type N-terminal cleavage/methylation domain-containing protein [Exiguobacterium sp.]MDX6772930.1 prepilin-type N-terminal cleavage/methylation domain-